jgi:hypothetical protein
MPGIAVQFKSPPAKRIRTEMGRSHPGKNTGGMIADGRIALMMDSLCNGSGSSYTRSDDTVPVIDVKIKNLRKDSLKISHVPSPHLILVNGF